MEYELKRPKDAAKTLGISLSTFWLWAKKDPDFPPLVKIGPRCTAVRVSDLKAFVDRKSGGMVSA
jgi:predicted DNA-binding transcriptional regulator AlpA